TTAGAKLSQNLLAEVQNLAANATLTEYYGASELGFVTTATHGTGIAAPQSVGTPFPGIDIEIRTPDADGNGEVWLRSDLIIDDYLWRDDAHGFRCVDGWSTVGDIGRLEAGALHLVGRAGGMVTSGGNNIYLDQVARHLDTHPDIKTALVLGIPDQYLGTKLVALIEPRAPALSAQDLVDYCQASLQKYKIPRAFFRVSDWPVTSSGKIATKELEMWVTEKDDRLAAL
uniref:AMP-binding enzyme n=1 Tax=Cognatishimia sp. TaxID=2211648 RepID=UPI003519A54F